MQVPQSPYLTSMKEHKHKGKNSQLLNSPFIKSCIYKPGQTPQMKAKNLYGVNTLVAKAQR
jgi:hypothetical protein